MRGLGLAVGRPDPRRLAEWRAAEPTYAHVGSTLDEPPPDRPAREATRAVGSGRPCFDAAVAALRAWAPQRAVGATVHPAGVIPEVGATLVLGLGAGPIRLLVPNRVVRTIDDPDRWGYAYGSLPGHPEVGEESFLVTHHADDTVTIGIRVHARPIDRLAPLAPVIHAVQGLSLRRYLDAVARAAAPAAGG